VIRWNDPALKIDWRTDAPTLGARDANAPLLNEIERLPKYGDV
jgi:dTDP-4-dehydrorhamnose 3,5-epimerase